MYYKFKRKSTTLNFQIPSVLSSIFNKEVKNYPSFCKISSILSKLTLHESMSLDVASFFPSIPHPLTTHNIKKLLTYFRNLTCLNLDEP